MSDVTADVFELGSEHEQVVFCNDAATGLKAIVAIHSTALGPALGGTRFYPYSSTADAVHDVLNLSRGMSYKASLAGLDLGGGKAVIIGDPATLKSEALLRAYGRFVQSLGGRYYTACDVGTYSADMDDVARECTYVTGRTVAHGGAGDSSVLTAYGVFEGMRAAAEAAWGAPSVAGRVVGVAGVGKVGRHLVRHLIEDGASVVVTDVHRPSVERVLDEFPQVTVVDSTEALVASPLDVYAPCALGGALTDEVVEVLSARIVCGAANNQLAHPGRREDARGARRALRAGLLRQLRRADPGRRRARGLLLRARPAAGQRHLRHHAKRVRARRPGRRSAGGGGRPAGRAPDARRGPAAGYLVVRWLRCEGRLRPEPRNPVSSGRASTVVVAALHHSPGFEARLLRNLAPQPPEGLGQSREGSA